MHLLKISGHPLLILGGFGSICCVSWEAPALVPAHGADLCQTLVAAAMDQAHRGSPGHFQAVKHSLSCRLILTQWLSFIAPVIEAATAMCSQEGPSGITLEISSSNILGDLYQP